MRKTAAALVILLLMAGCLGGGGGGNSSSSSSSSTPGGSTTTQESGDGEEFFAPEWKPGMQWTYRPLSDAPSGGGTGAGPALPDLPAYATTLYSLGKKQVGSTTYDALAVIPRDLPGESVAMSFLTSQQASASIGLGSGIECRGVNACLDDAGLADALADSMTFPIPLFPVRAGREINIHLPLGGTMVQGNLHVGERHPSVAGLSCFPITIHVDIEPTGGGAQDATTVTLDFALEYCPEALQMGRVERTTSLHMPDGSVTNSTTGQYLVDFDLDADPFTTEMLGRHFAQARRADYNGTVTGLPSVTSDAARTVVADVQGLVAGDGVHIQHVAPDGSIVAEGDGTQLDTRFDVAGQHVLRLTVTGPQDIVMLDAETRVGITQDLASTEACGAGSSNLPVQQGDCDPYAFAVGAGLDAIHVTASHLRSLGGGALYLYDAAGLQVAEGPTGGDAAAISYVPKGTEMMGEWSAVWKAATSLAGEVEYAVRLEAEGETTTKLYLAPVA